MTWVTVDRDRRSLIVLVRRLARSACPTTRSLPAAPSTCSVTVATTSRASASRVPSRIRPTTRSCCSSCASSARVNVWEWIQASLDSDIDLFKEQQFTGGLEPRRGARRIRRRHGAFADRGEEARARGRRLHGAGGRRARRCSRCSRRVRPRMSSRPGDVLLSVDGAARSTEPDQLAEVGQGARRSATPSSSDPARDGEEQTVQVPTEAGRRRHARHRRDHVGSLRLPDRRRRRHERDRRSVGRPRDDVVDPRPAHTRRSHRRRNGSR